MRPLAHAVPIAIVQEPRLPLSQHPDDCGQL